MKFADHIELTCQNEEMAKAVFMQIESCKEYCIENGVYYGIDDDALELQGQLKDSKVCITIPRPDYEGLYDPDFFDGSFAELIWFLDEKVPGAILSGRREYNNPDLYRSLQEILSDTNGTLSIMEAVEVDWKKINQLMDDGVDISEVCSILNMDEDEVWDGLSSLEDAEDCTDKTFVITGKLQFFENREAFSEHIQELGGKVTGSISSKTDFLICNDTASTSSKMKKAKELGIEVITEEEFIRRFGGPDEFELDEDDEEEWDEGKNDGALSASDKKDNAASHDTENFIRCAFCDSVSAKSDILKKRAPDGTVCFVCRECCTAYDLNDWETLDDE